MSTSEPSSSLQQAADRLNAALQAIEVRLQQKPDASGEEVALLEAENMQLHEENQRLRELLEDLETRLEMSILQVEELMRGQES